MADEAKQRGPSLKDRGRTNRGPVMFRLSEDVQNRIKAAADAAGRSMSEELERRIEGSLGPNEAMRTAIRDVIREELATNAMGVAASDGMGQSTFTTVN